MKLTSFHKKRFGIAAALVIALVLLVRHAQ